MLCASCHSGGTTRPKRSVPSRTTCRQSAPRQGRPRTRWGRRRSSCRSCRPDVHPTEPAATRSPPSPWPGSMPTCRVGHAGMRQPVRSCRGGRCGPAACRPWRSPPPGCPDTAPCRPTAQPAIRTPRRPSRRRSVGAQRSPRPKYTPLRRGPDRSRDPTDQPAKDPHLPGGTRRSALLELTVHPQSGILTGQHVHLQSGVSLAVIGQPGTATALGRPIGLADGIRILNWEVHQGACAFVSQSRLQGADPWAVSAALPC